MNLKSFLTVFLITFTVFSPLKTALAGVEINDFLIVEGELPSQGYYLTFEVITTGKTGEDIVKALSAVDNFVKDYFPNYRGGYFSIKPLWNKNREISKGDSFQGTVTYTVKILGIRTQEVLFDHLTELTKKFPKLHYRILSTRNAVDPALKEKMYNLLRFKLLQQARQRAKLYSDQLDLKCKLRKVNFGKVKPESVEPGENPRVSLSASVTYMCY